MLWRTLYLLICLPYTILAKRGLELKNVWISFISQTKGTFDTDVKSAASIITKACYPQLSIHVVCKVTFCQYKNLLITIGHAKLLWMSYMLKIAHNLQFQFAFLLYNFNAYWSRFCCNLLLIIVQYVIIFAFYQLTFA